MALSKDSRIERLTSEIASLTDQLAEVRSIHDIQGLKYRYADLVDRRYYRGQPRSENELNGIARAIASLFTEDAVWDGGRALGRHVGRAAIEARMKEPTLLFSWHFFVKPQIDVNGAEARAHWHILCPCTTRDGKPHWMVGTEEDEYVHRGNRWLHRSMKLRVVFLAPHDVGWEEIFV